MKYSVPEIDRMRSALGIIMFYSGIYSDRPDHYSMSHEGRAAREEQLRTYMLNGTTVEELEAAAEKVKRERDAKWDAPTHKED